MKKKKDNKKPFDSRSPFTLLFEGERVSFKNLEQFNKETGISGAIAYDMVLGRDLSVFKGWSRDNE